MSNAKHLTKGSEKPSFKDDGFLRLYTTRFCPWAGRVHLALEAKKIPYHTINVNIRSKPEWFLELNPVGKVPCVELVDKPGAPAVYESLLILEYLDEVYPEPKLYPVDPLEKLQEKLWIERFSPISSKTHEAYRTDAPTKLTLWNEIQEVLDIFEAELKRRGTTYFGGERQVNILDYALWPWFAQRIDVAQELFGEGCEFNGERFPALFKWFNSLNENDEGCRKLRAPRDIYVQFAEAIRRDGAPNFDLMVPK